MCLCVLLKHFNLALSAVRTDFDTHTSSFRAGMQVCGRPSVLGVLVYISLWHLWQRHFELWVLVVKREEENIPKRGKKNKSCLSQEMVCKSRFATFVRKVTQERFSKVKGRFSWARYIKYQAIFHVTVRMFILRMFLYKMAFYKPICWLLEHFTIKFMAMS